MRWLETLLRYGTFVEPDLDPITDKAKQAGRK